MIPKIKICGLSRLEDAGMVNEAGCDYAGFVFAPGKRRVTPAFAAKMRARLNAGVLPVGVFVNAPVSEIAALFRDGVIALAQLHGNEDEPYIAALKSLCAVPVIKALRVMPDAPPPRAVCNADYLLFDSPKAGSGTRFDWNVLRARDTAGKPWFLAGGLCAESVGAALAFEPFGLDISSGVESGGVKDRAKIARFAQAVRGGGLSRLGPASFG